MSYTVQTWVDNDPAHPVSAARMTHIESGIDAVANGGSLTFTTALTLGSDTGASGSGDIIFQTDGGIESVKIPNAHVSGSGAQYGQGSLLAGNDHNSDYGPQTGTPAGNVIPIRFQQLIGTVGTPVPQTTQLFCGWAKYKERTLDDSAESANFGIILTDAFGGFAAAQTLPVVGFEGDAIIQGAVSVTNKVIGITAGVQLQGTSHADSAMHFYAAQTNVVGTATNRYAFYDEGTTGAGTITNSWTLYGKKDVQTEARLYVGIAGVPSVQTQRVLLLGSSADSTGTLAVQMGAGQTSASIQVRDSGGVQHGQWFGNTGNLLIGQNATGGSGSALLSIATTLNPSGTPPAAGLYLYADTVTNDAKVKVHSGDVRVIWPGAEQVLIEGLGYKTWAFDPQHCSGATTALTAGTVYVRSCPYRSGQVITHVDFMMSQVGVGTQPTNIWVGVADSTGKMLALSNDLAASSIWKQATNEAQAPLSATWTVPADGLYYNVILQVGSWGTTQMTFAKGVSAQAPAGIGTIVFGTGVTTAQTTLPAVNSSIAGGIVTTNGLNYWTGAD